MTLDHKLEIVVASDVDYEQLIAEIYCDGKFVALLSQDDGVDNLKVVFPDGTASNAAIVRSVGLDWLKHALVRAEEALVGTAR